MKVNRSSTTHHEVITGSNSSGHADHARRFLTLRFLEQIRRSTLESFFDHFRAECDRARLVVRVDGPDEDYYFNLRCLFADNTALPPSIAEALRAVHHLSTPEAHHRLSASLAPETPAHRQRLGLCTPAELAMHVWLTAPELFARAEAELSLLRLTLFQYFGAARRIPAPQQLHCPPLEVLNLIQSDLDAWFASHYRGEETVRLHVHEMDHEFWFLVRHGDIFSRKAAVQRRATEILRFRPAKDDVVVYTPERNELRIHAGTEGEKTLYRQTFGRRLFGDPEYFCEQNAYTLDPLRADGSRALETHDIPGIARVRLAEVELKTSLHSDDISIHRFGTNSLRWPGIPVGALTRAVFDVYFTGTPRPRKVEICPPNQLRLARHCDLHLVQRWLTKRGFRAASGPKTFCAVNI